MSAFKHTFHIPLCNVELTRGTGAVSDHMSFVRPPVFDIVGLQGARFSKNSLQLCKFVAALASKFVGICYQGPIHGQLLLTFSLCKPHNSVTRGNI